MARNSSSSKLVYSTANDSRCPRCGKSLRACRCSPAATRPAGDGIVRVSRQSKGRKGKGVTLVTGVPLQGAELSAFAAELRKRCATGGALKDGVIEIQGDHRDRLIELIEQRGWPVKRAGG